MGTQLLRPYLPPLPSWLGSLWFLFLLYSAHVGVCLEWCWFGVMMIISKVQLFFSFLLLGFFFGISSPAVLTSEEKPMYWLHPVTWPVLNGSLTEELEGFGEDEPDCENWQARPLSGSQLHSIQSILINISKCHSMQWILKWMKGKGGREKWVGHNSCLFELVNKQRQIN